MTLEKELRTLSWLAAGQLIQVTIAKDGEGKFLSRAHLVLFLDENNDEESRESCEDGA